MIKKIIFSITFLLHLFTIRAADITFYINSNDCISCMLIVDKVIKENHYRSFVVISNNIKTVKENFNLIIQKYPKTNLVFSFDVEQAKKYKSYVSSLIIHSKKTNLEILNIPLIFANQVTNLLHLYLDEVNIPDTIIYKKILPKTINGAIHYSDGKCIYKVGAKNTGEKVVEIPDSNKIFNLLSEVLSYESDELKKINYTYEEVFKLYGPYLKERLDLINFYLDENGNIFYLMNLKYIDVKISTVDSKLDTTFVIRSQLFIIKQTIQSNSLSRYYIKETSLNKNQYSISDDVGFIVFKDIFYFFISPINYTQDRKVNYIAKAKLVNAILDVNEVDSSAIYPDCYKNYHYRFGGSGFDNNMHYFHNTTRMYYPIEKKTINLIFPDSLVDKINNSNYEDFFSNLDDLKRLLSISSITNIYPSHNLIIFSFNGNEYIGFVKNNKMVEAKLLGTLSPEFDGWHKMINLANGQLLFFDSIE